MAFEHKFCIIAAGIKSVLLSTVETTRLAVIVLAIFGGGRVFSEYVFKCPCDVDDAYISGLTFLIAPPLILMCVALALSPDLQWLVRRRRCSRLQAFRILLSAVGPPAFALFLSFLDGDYLACALSGQACRIDHEDYQRIVAWAQKIAWFSATGVAVALLLMAMIYWFGKSIWPDEVPCIRKRITSCKSELMDHILEAQIKEQARLEAERDVEALLQVEHLPFVKGVRHDDSGVEDRESSPDSSLFECSSSSDDGKCVNTLVKKLLPRNENNLATEREKAKGNRVPLRDANEGQLEVVTVHAAVNSVDSGIADTSQKAEEPERATTDQSQCVADVNEAVRNLKGSVQASGDTAEIDSTAVDEKELLLFHDNQDQKKKKKKTFLSNSC